MKWLVGIVVAGFVSLIALSYFIGAGSPPEPTGECNISGEGVRVNVANLPKQVGVYSGKQLENAALIINAGKKLGLNKQGQTIGVMTAIGESTLNNIDRGDNAGPDSRGLFQQRANGAWGTLEERMDPSSAATNFFKALMKTDGWESLPPTLAASRVQGNADPFHYEQHWSAAVEIVDELSGAKIVEAGTDSGGESDPKRIAATYKLGPVRDVTARAVGRLAPQFGIKTVGAYRESDPFPDHPSGLAADFMVAVDENGRAKGDRLAAYLTEHADQFGVEYLLWQQRSWYPDRGWRPMADRGSPTANHADHVHVTFKGNKSSGALPAASGCAATEASFAGGGSRVTPAKGPITSGFGPRNAGVAGSSRNHKGTDFGAPCGASIVATSPGRVVYAGPMSGYGHMIEVDHGKGVRSRYAHMYADGVLTRVGEKVKGGQEIAKVGSDGVSGGCHLHFEVLNNDAHVDPQTWLTQGKKS